MDPPIALQWSSAWVKVLGVYVGSADLEEENWRPRIEAVTNCLDSWRHRKVSFRGRAVVINALTLSRIWYVAALIDVQQWAVREINALTFLFFWNGKRDLVKRSIVIQPTSSGGFYLVSILVYTFLVAKHVKEPHCVQKFAPVFGPLYWPRTWDQLFWFNID